MIMRYLYIAAAVMIILSCTAPARGQGSASGTRIDLSNALTLGEGQFAQLFIPDYYSAPDDGHFTLVFHFHSASWAAEDEVYKSNTNAVLFNIHLGALSSPYQNYFTDAARFQTILDTIRNVLDREGIIGQPVIKRLILTTFSAGYAGVREVLKYENYYSMIDAITFADGLHASSNSSTMEYQMKDFVRFARDARDNKKVMLLTHSSIPTPGYQSTTQTADYLINAIGAAREPFSAIDEIGTQYSRCDTGMFHLRGYLGETAPDHMKHLYAMHLMLSAADSLLNTITGVDRSEIRQPEELQLYQNYPNPFNASTGITFSLPSDGAVKLSIYDSNGSLIETCFSDYAIQGEHTFRYNAGELASGVYLYSLSSSGYTISKKMILIK